MNNYTRKALRIAIVIAILLIGYGWYMTKKYNAAKDLIRDKDNYISALVECVQQIKDENGEYVGRIQQYDRTVKDLKNSKDSIERKLYEYAKSLAIKDKKIMELTAALISGGGTMTGDYYGYDTIIYIQYELEPETLHIERKATFKDDYLQADIYIPKTGDKAVMSYKNTVKLLINKHWQRERKKFFLWRWLGFGRKEIFVDIKSENPLDSIIDIRSINLNNN